MSMPAVHVTLMGVPVEMRLRWAMSVTRCVKGFTAWTFLRELHVREADLGTGADRDLVRDLPRELRAHGELAEVDALVDDASAERVRVLPGHAETVRRPHAHRQLEVLAQRRDGVEVPEPVEGLGHVRRVAVARERVQAVEPRRGPQDSEDAAVHDGLVDERVAGRVVEHRRRIFGRGRERASPSHCPSNSVRRARSPRPRVGPPEGRPRGRRARVPPAGSQSL